MTDRESMERYRLECEARHVLNLPFSDRTPYLERIEHRRGKKACDYLKDEIRRQYALRKQGK